MTWLVTQVWPWMLLTALLGAVLTALATTTRVTTQRWVAHDTAEERSDGADGLDLTGHVRFTVTGSSTGGTTHRGQPAREPLAGGVAGGVGGSPFPALPGHDASYRPWEQEELWSGPAKDPAHPDLVESFPGR